MNEFIVAEISKNWFAGDGAKADDRANHISYAFEQVIETNRLRGYALHSFQLHRLMTDEETMNETIIAVFRKVKK